MLTCERSARHRAILGITILVIMLSLHLGCASMSQAKDGALAETHPEITFKPGDKIVIAFGTGDIPPMWTQIVHADGTIALPLNLAAYATGKTPAELAQTICLIYVPQFLTKLTVKVRPEVRPPIRRIHPGVQELPGKRQAARHKE